MLSACNDRATSLWDESTSLRSVTVAVVEFPVSSVNSAQLEVFRSSLYCTWQWRLGCVTKLKPKLVTRQ